MTSIVSKPWGSFQVIEEGENYSVKKIIVKSQAKLSLQSHKHRSEHWVVVKGRAQVRINDDIKILETNESIFIPPQTKHRLANNDLEDLVIIEVWHGNILEEEDIKRYEDIYGRE
jgi:mannose-1-phosphate guanylyltransferase/mannose-6-phosphate isomerase